LVSELHVLYSDCFNFLLNLAFFTLKLAHDIHMVLNDLIVKDLLFLQPTHQTLHFLNIVNVLNPLVLLIPGLFITQFVQQALIVHALFLQLLVQVLHFGFDVESLVIWQVHGAQDVG
jgi:hypothetical protein